MTIPKLLFELLETVTPSNAGLALVALGIAGCQSARSSVVNILADVRAACRRLVEPLRGWSQGELERHLARARDHFDLERREREWSREPRRDGSLLGG